MRTRFVRRERYKIASDKGTYVCNAQDVVGVPDALDLGSLGELDQIEHIAHRGPADGDGQDEAESPLLAAVLCALGIDEV